MLACAHLSWDTCAGAKIPSPLSGDTEYNEYPHTSNRTIQGTVGSLRTSHDHIRRHLGGGGEVWPLPEAHLRPDVPGVHALGRRLRGHRVPGLHPGALVPGPGRDGHEAGLRLERGRDAAAGRATGQQIGGGGGQHVPAVRRGLELHGAGVRPAGGGPEPGPLDLLSGRLGVRLQGPPVFCDGGKQFFPYFYFIPKFLIQLTFFFVCSFFCLVCSFFCLESKKCVYYKCIFCKWSQFFQS